MADKTYTQKEIERILQANGQRVSNGSDIVDPDVVADRAKELGFSYDKDFDVWKESVKLE